MLEEDRHCYHKQRHTAKRIFERLRDEHGYDGSYSTVQRYLREARSKGPKGQSIRLGWDPGTMRVDFGRADFDYAFGGGRVRMRCLPMSFPYSSHEVCEVFGDERDVCLCQGTGLLRAYRRGAGHRSTMPPRREGDGTTSSWSPTSSAG